MKHLYLSIRPLSIKMIQSSRQWRSHNRNSMTSIELLSIAAIENLIKYWKNMNHSMSINWEHPHHHDRRLSKYQYKNCYKIYANSIKTFQFTNPSILNFIYLFGYDWKKKWFVDKCHFLFIKWMKSFCQWMKIHRFHWKCRVKIR